MEIERYVYLLETLCNLLFSDSCLKINVLIKDCEPMSNQKKSELGSNTKKTGEGKKRPK